MVNNNFGNLGYGLDAGMVFNPGKDKKPSAIHLGIDFGYSIYGIEKTGAFKTSFQVYTIGALARLKPLRISGKITPFVDGLVGARIYNARTKVDKNLLDIALNTDAPEVISSISDTGLCQELGIGFTTNPSPKKAVPGFTLRVLYQWNGSARYVVANSITIDPNGIVSYQRGRANLSMFAIQAGFSLTGTNR
ncbi:MAG: hypothetical protein ACKOAR_11115 [Bacteroidota bacterium]